MKANDLFDQITARMVADIEAGAGDWKMPWHALAEAGAPTSVDGRAYRGGNALWLAMLGQAMGRDAGMWGTYRAWQRHGAQVRKGEKATSVVLWTVLTDKRKGQADDEDDGGGKRGRGHLVAKAYCVFAAEQVEGAEAIVARKRARWDARPMPERIADAERLFAAIGADVRDGGNKAFYAPTADYIGVPALDHFDKAESYYGVLAHEHTHWTGHGSRLDRTFGQRFGDDGYAMEELVAELGAAFICGHLGIGATTRKDHAAYLGHWLDVLRKDARALLTVTSKAQAAADYLLKAGGVKGEREEEGARELVGVG